MALEKLYELRLAWLCILSMNGIPIYKWDLLLDMYKGPYSSVSGESSFCLSKISYANCNIFSEICIGMCVGQLLTGLLPCPSYIYILVLRLFSLIV